MKNNKLLIILSAFTMLLSACGGTASHEHTFDDKWTNNESSHWHKATCEHTDLTKDLALHTYGSDNKCTECGYEKILPPVPHEHTFDDKWTNNESSHWHAATCEHTDLTKDLGAHIDSNSDGKCDVCLYDIPVPPVPPVPHEHTFDDKWTNNESSHWHKATCEHTDLTKDLALHTYGSDNKCTECGYEKPVPPHEHTFSNEWSKNETTHWHAATCEHKELTSDLGKHVFNEKGECEVCKMAIPSNYRKVVLNGENLSLSSEYYYELYQSIVIHLSPLEGYTLPKDISVRGLSDYRYDNITGYITGVVTDNVIITANGVLKGSKYYIAKETYKRNGGYNETEEIKTYNFDKEKRELEYIETLRTYFSPSSYADSAIKIVSKYDESFRIIEEQKFNYLDNEYQLYETSYREYNEKGLISRIRTTSDGVGFSMKTWEYDEFNRQTKHYIYSNETDELPSSRYEYTYYEDYYEEKYYFSFDQLGWHYKYREEIDAENETKTIYKFTDSDEPLGSTVYDLFSGQILAVYTNTVCTVSKFNQNGDEVSGMRYYPNDPIVMETEVNDYYNRKGFIEYREITEYPTSEDPVHYIEDYTNVDGYVQSIQKYCIDTVPYSVAFEKTYEIAPFNIDIEMPEGLRPALTRGTYISLVDGYSF